MYSDEENKNLEAKLDILSQQVKIKRDQLELQENDEKEKIRIVKKANQIHQIKMTLKNSKTDLQEPIDF